MDERRNQELGNLGTYNIAETHYNLLHAGVWCVLSAPGGLFLQAGNEFSASTLPCSVILSRSNT